MYAAHAKKQKEETSKSQLQECIKLAIHSKSDNDRFAALLEITHHVWAGTFTDVDRRVAVMQVDRQLLAGLINNKSSADLYNSIALSIFAVLSVEQNVMQFDEIKDLMCLVNDVLSPKSRFSIKASPASAALYKGMCRECEEIVSNISQLHTGVDLLVDSGTASLLLGYFPRCQHNTHILSGVASVMRKKGDIVFQDSADTLNDAITLMVDKLAEESNLTVKLEYAKILTNILTGFSMIEVSASTDWVVPLLSAIQALIMLKLHPDDSECVMQLTQSLVSAVGPNVLDPAITGSFQLLKAVVARVSVEVYMLLDGILPENASERHSYLDGAYKLLCGAVQCAASLGEESDPESVIVVYRKLVDTRDTIIEFLYSVANQELELPQNHSVVLISVRALAAMLTEITEEPTPNLLKLLPFFNLLCQPVEYSDDVILEVKNATQAALENIKLMGMNIIPEGEGEEEGEEDGASSSKEVEPDSDRTHNAAGKQEKTMEALSDLSIQPDQPNYSNPSEKASSSKSHTQALEAVDYSLVNGEDSAGLNNNSSTSSSAKNVQGSHKCSNDKSAQSKSALHKDISLSQESIEEFRALQENISSLRAKPAAPVVRRASFSSTRNKKLPLKSIKDSGPDASQPWVPGPDDVLGYLLPAYMFLMDDEKALPIMMDCDSFQIVVNFLQRALSQLLEGKASVYPETVTTNALDVVEHMHTAFPDSAVKMHCFQDLFEIFMLSVPNLVNLPSPPPRVCLKLLETSLLAYKVHMLGRNKNTSLTRLKHSQARFFKAVVEYLQSAYSIKQHKRKPPSLTIAKDLRKIWFSVEESWASCLIGLSHLVSNVEELQDVLVKSSFLAEFLAFLRDSEITCLEDFPDQASLLVSSLLPLIESGAGASDHICEMVLYNNGMEMARNFNLRKLAKHLVRYSKRAVP